jgi:hypothetical protein
VRDSPAPSLPDDYLITPPYPKQPLLNAGIDLQRQCLLNVSADGGRSVLPEHCFSPIRLRSPLGHDYLVSRRSPQQLRPLARLRLQTSMLSSPSQGPESFHPCSESSRLGERRLANLRLLDENCGPVWLRGASAVLWIVHSFLSFLSDLYFGFEFSAEKVLGVV